MGMNYGIGHFGVQQIGRFRGLQNEKNLKGREKNVLRFVFVQIDSVQRAESIYTTFRVVGWDLGG